MSEIVHQIQQKVEDESKELQKLQSELQKLVDGRQRLIEQQHENEIVKKEFEFLEPQAKIYKLIGSVLINQTLNESRDNVSKRLEFIAKELKKLDDIVKDNQQKQAAKRASIQKMQEQLYSIIQQLQQKQQSAQQ